MSTEPINTELLSTTLPLTSENQGVPPWQVDVALQIQATLGVAPTLQPTQISCDPLPPALLPAEAEFYSGYLWCLNPFLTIRELVGHLTVELHKLDRPLESHQRSEVLSNVFLFSCAITDTIDDYLLGDTYDFSKVARVFPFAAPAIQILHKMHAAHARLRTTRLSRLRRWRAVWASAVTDFLQHAFITHSLSLEQCHQLTGLLPPKLPKELWDRRAKVPAFFRSRDFAPADCFELGRKFVAAFPNSAPNVVIGLRTAGSFLAPLLSAFLKNQGYDSTWLTIRPGQRLSSCERTALHQAAKAKARALIIDESIHSGSTLGKAVDLLHQAGFRDESIIVLNPVEPALPDWKNSQTFQSLAHLAVISLEPEERYKRRLLDSDIVQEHLKEYFAARGYNDIRLAKSAVTEELNRRWLTEPERVDIRLKRIYEVHLWHADGNSEIRYVVAKSVGCGWLGYHAFLAGQQLAEFVPPILGLRDGILYTEWLPQTQRIDSIADRASVIESIARYIAARTNTMRLSCDPTADVAMEGRHKGFDLLTNSLCRAFSSRVAASAMRIKLQQELSRQNSFAPVMTDSKMAAEEWLRAGDRILKSDFEHHCFGKNELSVTDPAFDLASAIFHFDLSEAEATHLKATYIKESCDRNVDERLFLNKLLVGIQAQFSANFGLQHPKLSNERNNFSRQYISAWNFLVQETVSECARLCRHPAEVRWHTPLAVLDIDGVIDRMVFGFPSTTAAGIKAISLLHSHGFAVALNTARTLNEVKHYCHAYGFAGGVAEYGSVIWDSVADRELVLVSDESMEQLAIVREAICKLPGCFLNDDYQYSLRAFTYQNSRTAPLPALLIQDLLASLCVDRLKIHHTGLDTAIVAKETDKGVGLSSLLNFVNLPDGDVIAIGDSEPDLAMFRVAGRSFAPGNVTCAANARLLGCKIAGQPCQPGLLEIVRQIIHPNGDTCSHCQAVEAAWPKRKSLFVSLLEAADEQPLPLLLRNLLSPSALAVFRKK